MVDTETTLSLGWYIGIPITIVLVLAGIAASVLSWRMRRYSDSYSGEGTGLLIGSVTFTLCVLVIFTFAWWPFKAEYHEWRPVSGIVEQNDRRMIGGDGGTSERFVIKFEDNPRLYGCDDTRCALATVAKKVTLKCKREFEWGAFHGWTCKYAQEA